MRSGTDSDIFATERFVTPAPGKALRRPAGVKIPQKIVIGNTLQIVGEVGGRRADMASSVTYLTVQRNFLCSLEITLTHRRLRLMILNTR